MHCFHVGIWMHDFRQGGQNETGYNISTTVVILDTPNFTANGDHAPDNNLLHSLACLLLPTVWYY